MITKKEKNLTKDFAMQEIYFNSKSKDFYKLSNFYGGVEANYMKDRFLDSEVHRLFDAFEDADYDTFIRYLQTLQPNKKDWTPSKLNYWMRNGQPITGILSQLVGSSVKDTPTARRRLKIVKELSGVTGDLQLRPDTTDEQKKQLMLETLRVKYSQKEFADILLSTGDAILHERPLRGHPNNWTFKDGKGGDWLGQLLMQVRDEIKLN